MAAACGAGLSAIDKSIRSGKPVTSMELTIAGREAREAHARDLLAALQPEAAVPAGAAPEPSAQGVATQGADDFWVD